METRKFPRSSFDTSVEYAFSNNSVAAFRVSSDRARRILKRNATNATRAPIVTASGPTLAKVKAGPQATTKRIIMPLAANASKPTTSQSIRVMGKRPFVLAYGSEHPLPRSPESAARLVRTPVGYHRGYVAPNSRPVCTPACAVVVVIHVHIRPRPLFGAHVLGIRRR